MEIRHKRGDVRADGRIFWDYRNKRGREIELWCVSETFKSKKLRDAARCRRRSGAGYKPDPKKERARRILRYAVRLGRVDKPDRCQGCGQSDIPLDGHHHNGYDKPLDAMWLCRRCHGAQHRKAA